jgi:ABC-2 type transport system permease protein
MNQNRKKPSMKNSLAQLILVQFKQFFREPAIIFWAIIFPILMSWVLGVAFTEKREVKKTVYVIPGHTRLFASDTTESLLGEETGNPVKVTFVLSTKEKAAQAIRRGEIVLFMEYAEDSILYHFDPNNADAQLTHLILEREFIKKSLAGSTSNLKAFSSSVSPLTIKGTRYIDFLIPGLIALGILNSCMWGIGWNLIETRMKKLLRRMIATPMKKTTFLSSLIITRIILSTVETLLLFVFAFFFFDITIQGSIPALTIIYLSGIFAFSSN